METKRFQKMVIIIGCVLVMVAWFISIYNMYYNKKKYPKYISNCPMYFKQKNDKCHLDIKGKEANTLKGCTPDAYKHSNDNITNHNNICKSYASIIKNCNDVQKLSWSGILDYEDANLCWPIVNTAEVAAGTRTTAETTGTVKQSGTAQAAQAAGATAAQAALKNLF